MAPAESPPTDPTDTPEGDPCHTGVDDEHGYDHHH